MTTDQISSILAGYLTPKRRRLACIEVFVIDRRLVADRGVTTMGIVPALDEVKDRAFPAFLLSLPPALAPDGCGRIVNTGQLALRTTASATLPRNIRTSPR